MIMKSVAAAFVVINSYKASGDMLGGRERGSGNESAQVGVGFGCGSIQFEGKWDDLRSQDSRDSSPLGLSIRLHQNRQIHQIQIRSNRQIHQNRQIQTHSNRQIHQIHRIRITRCTHTCVNRCRTTVKPPSSPCPFPFGF